MVAVTASAVATTWRTSAPVKVRMSSMANTLDGSAMATMSRPSHQPDGDGEVAPGQSFGHHLGGRRVHWVGGEVDELEAELFGQGGDELLLGEELVFDQDPGQVATALFGPAQRLAQLSDVDDPALDQDYAKLLVLGEGPVPVTHPSVHGLPPSPREASRSWSAFARD